MSEQVIKNKEDFNEDKGLQFIKKFLLDNINLSGLYCFGIHHTNKLHSNALNGEVTAKQHTHYYLLVYSMDHKANAVADLSDIIRKKSKGQYTVTLFIHLATTIRQLTPEKSYFFYHAMNKGITCMSTKEYRPASASKKSHNVMLLILKRTGATATVFQKCFWNRKAWQKAWTLSQYRKP